MRTQFQRLYWSEADTAPPLAAVHVLLRASVPANAVADYVLIEHTADHALPIDGFDTAWRARRERVRR